MSTLDKLTFVGGLFLSLWIVLLGTFLDWTNHTIFITYCFCNIIYVIFCASVVIKNKQ